MDIYQPLNIYQEEKKTNKLRYTSADHTPNKLRFDNNQSFTTERRGQTPKDENLQDILSSQKLRWAKKGSMKVSYLEDPSYNYVHQDIINQSFLDKSNYLNNQQQPECIEELDNGAQKKNNWTNNFIKILMKQKEKQINKTSQQFFDQKNIKQKNEISLQKMNEPPRYKLYQTSIQKRNLPPVKLKQLQYLQYFEEKKKNFPHLSQPLNEIFLQSPHQIINYSSTTKNASKGQQQSEQIRNHIQKESQFIFQDQNSKFEEQDVVPQKDEYSYINKAIQYLQNNSQKTLIEKPSYSSIQAEILNYSPARKLPRVFGQRAASPLNKIVPQYKKRFNQELKLHDLEGVCDQKNNFYLVSTNPQEKNQNFSIQSTQINTQIKNLSLNFSDKKGVRNSYSVPNPPPGKVKSICQTTKSKNTNDEMKFNFEIVNQNSISDKIQKLQLTNQNKYCIDNLKISIN
ncbi:hypothetical protein ABPG74_003192 [Tetrahymena malaccensis]